VIAGGQLGRVTANVRFHDTGDSTGWEQARRAEGEVALVDKRIRSLELWKSCARRAGLVAVCSSKARGRREIETPENNILVLRSRNS